MATFLVVDDDRLNRCLFQYALKMGRHQVIEAVDGEEGLALFWKHHPDLMIVDMVMPKMDGWDLIQAVRSAAPHQKILAVAAKGEVLLKKAREAGANYTLSKPFDVKEFLIIIEGCIPIKQV